MEQIEKNITEKLEQLSEVQKIGLMGFIACIVSLVLFSAAHYIIIWNSGLVPLF